MELSAVKTRQWILIALVVGLLVGATQNHYREPIHGNYVEGLGYFLGDQSRFETALTAEIDGRRRFHDITVYVRQVEGLTQPMTVYVVKGVYYSGPPQTAGVRKPGGWQPAFFVASVPYEPLIDFSTLEKPGSPDWGKTFRATGIRPTVLDFLAVMHSAAGVGYRFAWWDAHPVVIWTLVSVVVIGLLWPLLINVLTFRRMMRPPEARGISLWKVRNRKRAEPPRQVFEPFPDSEAPPAQISAPPLESQGMETSVRELAVDGHGNNPSLDPTIPREFGAREDDFYPTERHTTDMKK
jgi:hypothetical protein